jgi:O-antigen ligase
MAHKVQLGVGVAVAFCYALLVLLNLQLGIVLWVPFTALVAVNALNVGPNVAGLLIAFAWLGALATRYSSVPMRVLQNRRLLSLVGALVLWVLLSIAWAKTSPIGSGVFFRWIAGGAIMLIISTTLTDRRYLRLAAAAFVIGAVVSVVIGWLGAVQAPSDPAQEASARLVGGAGDPNFLAAGIVPAIMLAVGLAAGTHRTAFRWAAVGAVALLTIGLVGSESRGGFVAAIVAAVAAVVLAKQRRGWIIGLLLCILGAGLAWFSLEPAAWQRIVDFQESTGRTELWRVAWQMWQDHPIAGVGLGGFVDNAADYVRAVGPLEFETGIVGLGLYTAVVVVCLRCAWRAGKRFERAGDEAMAVLSRATIVAILAVLTANFFISGEAERATWVLFAFGPALLMAAGGEPVRASAAGARPRRSGRPWRGPPRPRAALQYARTKRAPMRRPLRP